MPDCFPRWLLLVAVGLASGFSCSQTIGSAPSSGTTAVDAQEDWQDTGFTVTTGDDVRIEYIEGQWTNWLDTLPFFGPDGGPSYVCSAAGCVEPLRGFPQGGLIGRIGVGNPFAVGRYVEFVADTDGMLQLRMNDIGTYDNKGSVLVRITLDQSLECGLWLDAEMVGFGVSLDFTAGCR